MEPTFSEFTIMFSIATVGMLVLALAIVFFVLFYQKRMLETRLKQQRLEAEYQQKMLLAALESQENERQRLSADLHDSIGAMLSTIRLSMLTLARQEKVDTENINQTKKMLDDTIESVRRISRDLMPSTLEKFGLSQAIREMCDRYSSISGMNIEFNQEGDDQFILKSKEVMLFRIIQELLNNAIKHSGASMINVLFQWNESLLIAVEDDGIGFNFEEKKHSATGIGLFNMQSRAQMTGSVLAFDDNRSKGTKATLILPLT